MQLSTRSPTLTRRLRASRSRWWGARARNVLARKGQLAALLAPVFLGLATAFLVIPAGARKMLAHTHAAEQVDDTISLLRAETRARLDLAAADSMLALQRQRRRDAEAEERGSRDRETSHGADSLGRLVVALDALIARAANAPLLESYRAIAESPALRGNPRIGALLDSLSDVDRERDEFGTGAAVDPVFVALTTRANVLGREIVAAANEARAGLRRAQLAASRSRATSRDTMIELPDTIALALARYTARALLAEVVRATAQARRLNETARSLASAERAANRIAPVSAILIGSVVLALVLAFGLLLVREARSPRIADLGEAELAADAHALGVVGRTISQSHVRRRADRERPSSLDPEQDAYRLLAWHASAHVPPRSRVVVVGDEPVVAGTVAANLAAVLANEARSVLLLDIDFLSNPVARALSIRRAVAGMVDILGNRRQWSEAVIAVTVGRGNSMDCIPAGIRPRAVGPSEGEALRAEIQRASRRYDMTVVNAPLELAGRVLSGEDAVICARRTSTKVSTLVRSAERLRLGGSQILCVALWERKKPTTNRNVDDGTVPPGASTHRHSQVA